MTHAEYDSRRDFAKTPEPEGSSHPAAHDPPIFVMHHHGASTDHFDFRLESGGVLRSWALPKGPSTDTREKRLAVPTEDHPVEYADFEGVIPDGEYGAGPVLIWDRGTYRAPAREDEDDGRDLDARLADGYATVWLEGQKLRGGYALVRIATGEDERWLFVKMDDDEADARRNPVSTEPESVVSGKTLVELADEVGATS